MRSIAISAPDFRFDISKQQASFEKTKKRINSFLNLPTGWRYGEGVKFEASTVTFALCVHDIFALNEAEATGVFPCVDGSVLVSGYYGEQTVDVTCRPDDRLNVVLENEGNLEVEKEGQDLDGLKKFLGGLEWRPRSWFDYSTRKNSANTKKDSRALPSVSLQGQVGFLSLTETVPLRIVSKNACILKGSTSKQPEPLQSFGISSRTRSPANVISRGSPPQVGIYATGMFALQRPGPA